MKHIIITLLLATITTLAAGAATHIYQGSNTYPSKILYTYDGRHIYQGSNTYPSKILYTYDGQHLYQGSNTYPSKIQLTFDGIFPILLITIL